MPLHDIIRQRAQPFTAALTSNRIFLYSVFSTFAVAATIANACRAHSNFYSVAIYLSNSSRSVLVRPSSPPLSSLYSRPPRSSPISVSFALFSPDGSSRRFSLARFSPERLRYVAQSPSRVSVLNSPQRLYDQTWMFVTESLLAFTIFRDEFDVPFLLMFGFLLFVKCFHWLMADRVESVCAVLHSASPLSRLLPLSSRAQMDQTTYPGPPTLFHIRINSLFAVLWGVDFIMFAFAVESTLNNGVGGMVLFASEVSLFFQSPSYLRIARDTTSRRVRAI